MITTDRTVLEIPDAEYRARKALSFHELMDFATDQHYWYRRHIIGSTQSDETESMHLGTAIHCAILDGPDAFGERYVVAPEEHCTASGSLSTKQATVAWVSEQREAGRIAISADTMARIDAVCARLRYCHMQSYIAEARLARGVEVSVVATAMTPRVDGIAVKGRIDALFHAEGNIIIDLKTIGCMDDRASHRDRFSYVAQVAWYTALYHGSCSHANGAVILTVETRPPHRVHIERITHATLTAQSVNLDHFLESYHRVTADLRSGMPIASALASHTESTF